MSRAMPVEIARTSSGQTTQRTFYGSHRSKVIVKIYTLTPGSLRKLFVAGSIYGGAIFNPKDGKVVQILIGAAAE